MNEYYVYEWIRLDYNEPFYIGKGKGDRWKDMNSRGDHFRNIVNKVPTAVIILNDNLTNDEALKTECWYIWQLRDIQGYNLVNGTDGGDGGNTLQYMDEQQLEKYKEKFKGENNPMYGKGHGHRVKVEAKSLNGGETLTFENKKLAYEYFVEKNIFNQTVRSFNNKIKFAIENNAEFLGYKWRKGK